MPYAKWDSRLLYHLLDLVRLFKGRRQRLLREQWFPGGGGGANDRQTQCLSRGKTDRIHIGIRDRLFKIRAQLLRRKPLPANLEVVFGNIAAGMQRRFGGFYQIGQMLPLGQHPASHNGESYRICGAGIGACLFVHMQSQRFQGSARPPAAIFGCRGSGLAVRVSLPQLANSLASLIGI